ncbi:uncharacterized protein LOC126885249 [Diabrotica virgifera virgifera]|uniref:Uncharacterized protein n=1 Tax=Diabrotica virgifera virgifera TaxID=50390 RepID=A0ABM5KBX2_DIAVI|nr:uncharacterized protein LOC126885249 [Diabrotica virgifera virgifera]
MKLVYCVCFLLLFGVVAPDAAAFKEKVKRLEQECQNDKTTYVDEAELERFRNHEPTTATNLGLHYLCTNIKLGIQDENGKINTEAIKNNLREIMVGTGKINIIAHRCSRRLPEESAEESAITLYRCLHKPAHVHNNNHTHIHVHRHKRSIKRSKAHKFCQSDESTRVNESDMEKFKKGEEVDTSKIKNYIFCMNKKFEIQNVDGTVNKDGFKKYLENKVSDKTRANELTRKCSEISDPVAEETAIKLYKCVHENDRQDDQNQNALQQQVKLAFEQCQADPKTFVDKKTLKKARKGKKIDTAGLRAHTFCMSLKLNLQSTDGSIKTETVRKNLEGEETEAKINIIVNICGTRDENDPANLTALKLFKCLYKYEKKREQKKRAFLKRLKQFKKFHQECLSDPANQVDEEVLSKFSHGEEIDDPNLASYTICLNKKIKYQDKKGKIKKDAIIDDLKLVFDDRAEAEKVVNECVAKTSGLAVREGGVKLTRCIFKHVAIARAAQNNVIPISDRR